jgi:hypothetical protein
MRYSPIGGAPTYRLWGRWILFAAHCGHNGQARIKWWTRWAGPLELGMYSFSLVSAVLVAFFQFSKSFPFSGCFFWFLLASKFVQFLDFVSILKIQM